MDWITAPIELTRTAAVLLLWSVGALLGLGAVLAVAHADLSWVLAPLATVVQAVAWLVWLAEAVWRPLLITLAVVGVVGVWQLGRRSGALPAWATPAHGRVDATMVITPGGIATALAHLGIPALNRAVKDGWQVEFSTPPVRVNRRGYQAVFSLPMGVTPEMIADKRDVLARNLVRAPLEVWPAAADHAGYVDLWVADPGRDRTAAPPYPLLHEGRVDVFTGVPLGVSQRGDVIAIELPGANLVYGGLMGQGKSNAARVTMLGAALDPLAVLWVFVFANNGDFDAYQPRLARYHRGVDDHDRRRSVGRVAGAVQHGQRPRRPGWPTWGRRRSPAPWPRGTPNCGRWWRCSPSATNCSATPASGRKPPTWPRRCCAGAARPRSRWRSTPSPRGRTRSRRGSSSW